MGFRIGRVLIWWVILFLVSFVFLQQSFIVSLMTDYGTTMDELLPMIMVTGLIIISLVDATVSD